MKKTIKELDLKGKRVLIRVDFNVPLNDEQKITDDNRIRASLPTIRYALDQGAHVFLMSHLGRPKGKPDPRMSLKPVADHLATLIQRPVVQCSDCIGSRVQKEIANGAQGAVVLLENLRFHPEEEKNDQAFARELAQVADLYVNDAFGTSHRAHASVAAIARFLPAAAGFLLEKEIEFLGGSLRSPQKPFVVILGGAKVSDKIGIVENMIDKVDRFLIGGAMAYTFLKVKGIPVGDSRVESDKLNLARDILKKAEEKKVELLLPEDHVVVREFKEDAEHKVSGKNIEDGWMGVDIGPETTAKYSRVLRDARTVIWNGPMGVFEMEPFKHGSLGIAETLADNKNAVTIIGGGDTAACVIQSGLAAKMSHISTGGGASLEYLEGRKLPGIEAIPDR